MEVVKNDNYPVKQETGLTKTSNEQPEEDKESQESSSSMDVLKEAALLSFVEGILPKLKQFIKPAVTKLEDYFGDDEKVFLITRKKDKAPRVIVLDNTKGSYCISNENFDASNPEYLPKEGETDEVQTQRLINEAIQKAKDDLTLKIENIKNRKNAVRKKIFEADQVAVINVHATDVFIEKLMSGEFTKGK